MIKSFFHSFSIFRVLGKQFFCIKWKHVKTLRIFDSLEKSALVFSLDSFFVYDQLKGVQHTLTSQCFLYDFIGHYHKAQTLKKYYF